MMNATEDSIDPKGDNLETVSYRPTSPLPAIGVRF